MIKNRYDIVKNKAFNFLQGAGSCGVCPGMAVGLKLNEKRKVVRIDRLDRQGRRY
jgi:thiamine pyrophosphate-dependent acetolactate synthase large subunit-like protein